jgi:hypothetical protein
LALLLMGWRLFNRLFAALSRLVRRREHENP